MIRLPGLFDQALGLLPKHLMKDEAEEHQLILLACHRLAKQSGVKPDEKKFKRLLKEEVRRIGQEESHDEVLADAAGELVGEGGFIDAAFEEDVAGLSESLARSLLKRYLYELEMILPLQKLLSDCGSNDQLPANLPEVLAQLQERARKLEGIDAKSVKTFGEEWGEHEARLKQFRGRKMIGLRTGLAELDRRTLGLRGLFIVGAKPGAGKTTYALEVALGVCANHAENKCVVVFVCLDMDRYELYRRVHCNLGDIEWVPLMFGSPEELRGPHSMFSKADDKRLKRAEERLKEEQVGERLVIPDRAVLGEDVTVQRLSAIVQEQKARTGSKRALVIIDYLQLIPVPEEVAARGDLAADKYRVRVVQQVIDRTRTADDPLGDTALVISEARKPPTKKGNWGRLHVGADGQRPPRLRRGRRAALPRDGGQRDGDLLRPALST